MGGGEGYFARGRVECYPRNYDYHYHRHHRHHYYRFMIVVIAGRPSSHRHYDFAARRFTPAFRRPPTAEYRRLSLLKLPAHIIRFRHFRTALFTLRRPAKGLFSKNRLSSEHAKSLSCSPPPPLHPVSLIFIYMRV